MNRRNFFGTLAGAAALTQTSLTEAKTGGKASLPTPCDLSMRSLSWAVEVGKEKGYGKPLCLIIGSENLFIAREIFGRGIELTYTPDPEDQQVVKALSQDVFGYRVVSALPMNFWMVQFERGTVSTQGP